ncbi:SDR family NAD(P)-dependent oxidoreductase [Arthrobacter sp. SDTb3-6]|uniref:SDR family NAD(P)-dependent oxidoreductase n=1 Tax=Arthrobacter sp. SDTb3-6 TaxID=2713571 RepID=UPI00159CF9B7|nr:SDR family oxidoreductase [Arthrobacter sp. SDTb3-6]NVN00135.1 SDR family oxidoreductase [Arthrobacter sp. SDTb3-6]
MPNAPAPSAGTPAPRVLVIGAGGIGAEVCRGLAASGAGLFFTYHANREAAAGLAAGLPGAGCARLDATDPDAVAEVVAQAAAALGGIDVLVVTAGHRHGLETFERTTPAGTGAVLATELGGPMNAVRAVLPSMQAAGFGRIVLVGSDSGKTGSFGDAASSAARGGLIAFAKSIARETAAADITINVVCPGPTDTELLAGLTSADGLTGKVMNAIVRAVPKRRTGTAAEVAAAVAFLAGAGAGFITGQAVSVSGGLAMQ